MADHESPRASGVPQEEEVATPSGIPSEIALERFARTFETSARRWELVVYPALFAFIILAGYGFFLIFSLTQDMHTLAKNVDPNMSQNLDTMAGNISSLSLNIASMTDRINEMSLHIETMTDDTGMMTSYLEQMHNDMSDLNVKMNTLEPMLVNIADLNTSVGNMTQAVKAMTTNTAVMTRDVGAMSNNVARPMSFMNQFFPW